MTYDAQHRLAKPLERRGLLARQRFTTTARRAETSDQRLIAGHMSSCCR